MPPKGVNLTIAVPVEVTDDSRADDQHRSSLAPSPAVNSGVRLWTPAAAKRPTK